MTFPKDYNVTSLNQKNLIVKRIVPENYEFGRIEIEYSAGNRICVYDLERTLCDILRGSGSDVQIVGEAMKRYAVSKDKNIHRLMQYADQLHVKLKVLRYMEVLLWLQKNPMQLKAFIKNKAAKKHISAQLVMQNYMLERLLERISLSPYKNNFILKGVFLISSVVGLDTRVTMYLDTTVRRFPFRPHFATFS